MKMQNEHVLLYKYNYIIQEPSHAAVVETKSKDMYNINV